jgi:hypothetical protein
MKGVRTVEQAAAELDRHPELLRRWLNEKKPRLRGEKIAGRWFITVAELNRFRRTQPERRKRNK